MRKLIVSWIPVLLFAFSPVWGAPMKSIVSDKVNVRSGPGTKHDILYRANLGYPVEVEQQLGDWVKIKDWQGDQGWVSKAMVGNIKTVVVLGTDANVRRAPGRTESSLGKVNRGEIYKVLGKKSGWVKLGYYDDNQEVGWIREDLVWGH